MSSYKVLSQQKFESDGYAIVPIRMEDRHAIMQWRNEQIYHLRQEKPLTKEAQDNYFNEVVAKLFKQGQPEQILFSYLKDGECIGYGGLVHINWIDKNAEISFIMKTSLEEEQFEFHWITYLSLIEKVAFEELKLHKIFTYAFDLRPRLYISLEKSGFRKEAQLSEHSLFDGKYIDVLIHAKYKNNLLLREATLCDLDITYQWANDNTVRAYAYNQNKISKEAHSEWFTNKLKSDDCKYFILEENYHQAGSIRFDIENDQQTAKISYLVDPKFVGKGYGTFLMEKGVAKLINSNASVASVYGHVLKENLASIKIFEKLGYKITSESDSELKFEKKLK
ncbi:GNAT family N-acetyltransferase [Marivirga sp.]|uniref:GNAT family N-acetyltransferase n=1 Tax=Marivirga sp. TaxID=2018662 RepID=UPI003DA75E3F